MYLLYPFVMLELLLPLSCHEIDDSFYMVVDYTLECWTETHWVTLATVVIPSLLTWGAGIPLALFGEYARLRSQSTERWNSKIYYGYGFMIVGYRDSAWYWEAVILVTKTFLISVCVFCAYSSKLVRAISAILALIMYLAAYVHAGP